MPQLLTMLQTWKVLTSLVRIWEHLVSKRLHLPSPPLSPPLSLRQSLPPSLPLSQRQNQSLNLSQNQNLSLNLNQSQSHLLMATAPSQSSLDA